MKYFFDNSAEIEKAINVAKNSVLMFDFDGTLSVITKTPQKAFIEQSTKNLLKKLASFFYVAVVSGRALSDVEKKVGLSRLFYAGNHGLEWHIGKKKESIKISKKALKQLSIVKKTLQKIVLEFPGVIIEDKRYSLAVHYRLLDEKFSRRLLQALRKIISEVQAKGTLVAVHGKKVIEIKPEIHWNKGKFVEFLIKLLQKKIGKNLFSFYIGDDATDEDAFKVLKNSVTVCIGKNNQSAARYFIKNNEIDRLLLWFLETKS